MRALHTIAALAMLGAAAPSVRLAGDSMFAARLRPRRYPSGRFYRPQVGGPVSRPQRRAAERALNLWHLTGTFPRMLRRERRAKSRDTVKCNEMLVAEGVARFERLRMPMGG